MQEVNSTQGRGKGPETWQRAHASQDPSQKQFPAGSVLVLGQSTVLRRVKGQREEFLQLAGSSTQEERGRESGNRLCKLGGRRSGREGRGLLEAHQDLARAGGTQASPASEPPPVLECLCPRAGIQQSCQLFGVYMGTFSAFPP